MRRILMSAVMAAVVSLPAHAQSPCNWVFGTTVSTPCKLGVFTSGDAIFPLQVHVNTNANFLARAGSDWTNGSGVSIDALNDAFTTRLPMFIGGNPTVFPVGNVGIGTVNPQEKLEVWGNVRVGTDFGTMPAPSYGGLLIGQYGGGAIGELQFLSAASSIGYGFRFKGEAGNGGFRIDRRANSTTWSDFVTFSSDGNVGIGVPGFPVATPTTYINSGAWFKPSASGTNLALYSGGEAVLNAISNQDVNGAHIGGVYFTRALGQSDAHEQVAGVQARQAGTGTLAGGELWFFTKPTGAGLGVDNARMMIRDDGKVVIGNPASITATAALNVAGDINVSGNINAKYQDVAEWVDARGALEPGTVVVLDPSHDDQVMPSASPYDTTVAGVVSAMPGVILGTGASGKEKIATTGRVKVRVDATRAPIRIGDLLVTSDVLGTAMRSEPVDVAGAKFHRPGTVVGKALQALPEGRGEILVLLSLQ